MPETGTEPRSTVTTRRAGRAGTAVRDDFVAHFADGYRLELAAWAVAARAGTVDGPDAWDGYLANVAAAAGVRSLRSGEWEAVVPVERPALYGTGR